MSKKVSLLFGVHAHQPAGNFDHVLNDAHARCYKPFIETVYRYPDFKLSVHFSGWLLGYLLEHFPEDMKKLREMVARGQVEMFGGGDTEPVLASIPERDRRSQLVALSDRLEAAFGQRPSGAWLTERVWESGVGPSLADSGIRYVTVDDYHFLCAGKNFAELTGYFSTEEGGIRLDLFPISEALRYLFPPAPRQSSIWNRAPPKTARPLRSTSTTSRSSVSGPRPTNGCTRRSG
jgi:4-alpha-glucanotransferase/alpha-amylase